MEKHKKDSVAMGIRTYFTLDSKIFLMKDGI